MNKIAIKSLKGVSILAFAGFLSKVLAALYRFPYQNLVGDQGFYAFQQVYPFYSIITTLSLTALPNFLSSLIHSSDNPEDETRHFFQLSFILSILSFIILLIFHHAIAKLMGQEKLAQPLVMATLPILLVPFLSLYRGRLQAQLKMTQTAFSQIIEQVVRVSLIICAALLFTHLSTNVYVISFLAMLGSFIGGVVALGYLMSSSRLEFKGLFVHFTDLASKAKIVQKFGLSSLVFTFFMVYMLLLQMIDVFFVKNALMQMPQGMTSNRAEILKGIYDRGQPFLQLGLVLTTSILTDALPHLTKLGKIPQKIWHNVVHLSIALTVGLVILLPDMNDVLFKSHDQSLSLQLFILQVPLFSIIQLHHHDFFLKGKNKLSALILLTGLSLKLLLVYPLTVSFGLIGTSLSSVLTLIVIYLLYSYDNRKAPKELLNLQFWLAIMMMSIVVLTTNHFLVVHDRFLQFAKILLLTVIGAITFFKLSKLKFKDLIV
ncbi:MAG: oligosaccharide flippase family protein [Streptococcaceae bacterium]|nr:oligosaccharide flippase family protein [Streptococcaceae bacterium]